MTSIFNILRSAPKHFAIFATLVAAFASSVSVFAAPEVTIEGNLAVANYTQGDTTWQADSVDASYDDVVRFKIYYHNTELPDSGKIAESLSVKIDLPTTAGSTQTATVSIKGDNTNTVVDTASVNLDRSDAYLEFVPGSAEWKHNVGTRENVTYETLNIADSVITGDGFTPIENEQPCYEFEAWITFAARVRVPSVEIQKEVADSDEKAWAEEVTSAPGGTVKFLLTIRNNGNARVNSVTVKDFLPEGMTYVPGSTKVFDSNNLTGVTASDNIVGAQGINIGDLPNDTIAYVSFSATIDGADSFECGINTIVNRAQVVAISFNGDEDTAQVRVNKTCTTGTPQYSCEALVGILDNSKRSVSASVKVTMSDDVTLNGVSVNFGDGTVVNNNNATHTYSADGDYNVTSTVKFNVGSEVKTATCTDSVSFNTPTTPVTQLPNTGAGESIAVIFGAITALAASYGFVQNRRLV